MRRFRRDKDHRKALLVNLTKNLILHKSIKTTLPKAKDLREFIEPIINRSKVDSLHNRRIIAKKLMNDWDITKILFEQIASHIKNRNGGYLRILRCGIRKGDGSTVGVIQFVDIPKINSKKPQGDKHMDEISEQPAGINNTDSGNQSETTTDIIVE